jgi:hypothetical protein
VKVDKLSVSFAPDVGDAVREAAHARGSSISAWLEDAAAAKLRSQALAEYLREWEAEHGALSEDELARAAAELGVAASASAAA